MTSLSVCAAPHLPAGILSPYSDGERGAVIDGFANHHRSEEGRPHCGQPLLPVSIRGEVPGRAMSGGADSDSYSSRKSVGSYHLSEAIALKRVATQLVTLLLSLVFLVLPALSARAAMSIQEVTSSKGITAWLVEDYSVPLVAIRFAFDGGTTQDPAGKEGLANLMSGLFDEGAGNLDSEGFQIKLDDVGAEMSFEAARDGIYGSMRMLAEQRDGAFDLLRLAVTEPRFDQAPIDRIRAQVLSGIIANELDPDDARPAQMAGGTIRHPSLCAARRGHQAKHRHHHAGRSHRLSQGEFCS